MRDAWSRSRRWMRQEHAHCRADRIALGRKRVDLTRESNTALDASESGPEVRARYLFNHQRRGPSRSTPQQRLQFSIVCNSLVAGKVVIGALYRSDARVSFHTVAGSRIFPL